MQYEDAYIDGFCKAAEVAGIDPVVLYKRAQAKKVIGEVLGRAAGSLARGGRAASGKMKDTGVRLLELVRGGNRDIMGKLHTNEKLDGILARPLFGPNGVFQNAASSAGSVVPYDASVARSVRLERILNPLKRRLNAIRGGSVDRDVTVEARKALAAQLGVGAAAAGTVGGAGYAVGDVVGRKSEQNKPWYDRLLKR